MAAGEGQKLSSATSTKNIPATSPKNLSFSHTLGTAFLKDVTYHYEWSTDLRNWNRIDDAIDGIEVSLRTSQQVRESASSPRVIRVTADLAGSKTIDRIFFRLAAQQNPLPY